MSISHASTAYTEISPCTATWLRDFWKLLETQGCDHIHCQNQKLAEFMKCNFLREDLQVICLGGLEHLKYKYYDRFFNSKSRLIKSSTEKTY